MGALSRRKGTDGERAVVRLATSLGVPARRVIRTADQTHPDEGDVWLWDGRVVVQVKAGRQAQDASYTQIGVWFTEAQAQSHRVDGADMALLVTQRRGQGVRNAGLWCAHLMLDDLASWRGGAEYHRDVVTFRLGGLLRLLQESA
jgi:hypothetical protein